MKDTLSGSEKKQVVLPKVDFFPHRKKAERLKKEITEYKELQGLAYKLGDGVAYKALDSQIKDLFVQYLVTVFIESLYFLVPHFFAMGLLAMVARQINIFGVIIPITIYYPVLAFAAIFTWRRHKKKKLAIQQQVKQNDQDEQKE